MREELGESYDTESFYVISRKLVFPLISTFDVQCSTFKSICLEVFSTISDP